MIAIHDALRRDLDQLLHATASHASARARWAAFRSQLRFHLAAEHAAMWPRVRPKLAGFLPDDEAAYGRTCTDYGGHPRCGGDQADRQVPEVSDLERYQPGTPAS